MRELTTLRQFEFPLEDAKLAEMAKAIGDNLKQVAALEDALAAAKENAKGIGKLMQGVREMGVVIDRGSEMRDVTCTWKYDDPEPGLKTLYRNDDGTQVENSTGEMSDEEKQGDLFIGEGGLGQTPPAAGGDKSDDADPMNDPNLRIPEAPKE